MTRTLPFDRKRSKKAAKEIPGWIKLWSALSFVATLIFLMFVIAGEFNFGSGAIVAPLSELVAAVVMAFVGFAPTLYWLGRFALKPLLGMLKT